MSTDSRPSQEPEPGTLKETERVQQGPGGPGRGPMGGGMIGQKADTFWPSLKRLLARLRPERHKAYAVLALTLVSVVATARRAQDPGPRDRPDLRRPARQERARLRRDPGAGHRGAARPGRRPGRPTCSSR